MTFVLAAGDADRAATLDLRDLADDRADRAGGGRDHDGLAWLRLADIEQPEIGGEPRNSIDAQQMRHWFDLGHLCQMLRRYGGIVLPAGIAEYDVARLQFARLG